MARRKHGRGWGADRGGEVASDAAVYFFGTSRAIGFIEPMQGGASLSRLKLRHAEKKMIVDPAAGRAGLAWSEPGRRCGS